MFFPCPPMYYIPNYRYNSNCNKTLLFCGKSNGYTLTSSSNEPIKTPITLACIPVDITSFIDPVIKIDFSANISSKARYDETENKNYPVFVKFQLLRQYKDEEKNLNSWLYRRSIEEIEIEKAQTAGEPPKIKPPEPKPPIIEPPVTKPPKQITEFYQIHTCDPISFQYCECVPYTGCLEYCVNITEIQAVPGVNSLCISNINMSALAQSTCGFKNS